MKMMRKSVGGIVGVAGFIAALCCVALAADLSGEAEPAAVDASQYADFMSEEVLDIQDLAQWAEIQRRFFNRITPAGGALFQPMSPPVVPFDAANFKGSFLDDLLGEDQNSVAIYPLSLALDPETRETLIYNADGKLIAAVSQNNAFPAVSEGEDPSRVMLQLDLLPTEDVEPYLYVERRVTESLAAAEETIEPGGAAMMSLEEGEFGFVEFQSQTNGTMRLTVTNSAGTAEVFSYTVWHTADVVVVTYTNEQSNVVTDTNTLWYPVSPPYNGMESAWTNRTTNLACTNGVGVWEDANLVSNARVRFYAVTLRTDSDGDGLTDGTEYFVHHTNPGTNDTDGDGMWDGWEILYGLNTSSNDALLDPDGDGRVNIEEFNYSNSTYYTACIFGDSNPTNKDTDGDGVTDGPLGGGGAFTNGPDAFPRDPCAVADTDCDGQPDALTCTNTTLAADADDDDDGFANTNDTSVLIPSTVAPFKTVEVQTISSGNSTSSFASMTVAGNFFGADNWSPPLRNMTLISNQVWEYVHFFTNETGMEFKFVANGDWASSSWGDNSQTSTNIPVSDTADLGSGVNIKISGKLYGECRFRFHEGTRAYEIVSAPPTFDLSSSGRNLPYAAGSNAKKGYGKVHGGIFFNHDGTNLFVGLAGLDPEGANVFMLFLDTDGTNGGVRTLAGLTGDPQGFGNADNITFDSANFTPNVGILVGDRRFDGRNFPAADLGQGAVGQGVYKLATNGIFPFPGFSTNISGGFSQWGDRIAGHRAPNAGIEIRLSLTNLGVSTGNFIQAVGLFAGGTGGTNRYLSGEVYGQSISGPFNGSNYETNGVTLIGAPVYLSSRAAPSISGPPPLTDDDVILQGFYWDVPTAPSITNAANKYNGIWYDHVRGQAQSGELARFTMVWLPPPTKGDSGRYSVGYDVRDHYDLGAFDEKDTIHTRYGSETDLVELVSTLDSSGIVSVVDLVMNHMNGGYGSTPARYHFVQWDNKTPFPKADVSGQTNANGFFNYNNTDWPFRIDFGFGTTNELAMETVLNMGPDDDSADINQLHPYMRKGLETWGAWLSSHVGYCGYRFDFTQGKEPWFTSEFMHHGPMRNKFAVMEYWVTEDNATVGEFETWLALTDFRAAAFDMRLHQKLEEMCNFPATFNMETLSRAGLVGVKPQWAVPFVESHDTVRAFGGDNQSKMGIRQKKELAYAYVLLSEGRPMVFYHDYYEQPYANQFSTNGWSGTSLKSIIDPLIDARKKYAAGTTSYLTVSNNACLYIAKRSGVSTNDGCLLVINNSTNSTLWNTVQTGWTNSTMLVDVLDTNHTVSVSSGVATVGASNRSYRVYVRQEIYQP